ncbi:MAG: hypothetical protein ACI4VQ_06295 [Clostridia bacterium]
MEKDINKLLEEMTKVNPKNLTPNAYDLFETINKILDERDILIDIVHKINKYIKKEKNNISEKIYNDLINILNHYGKDKK